MRCSCSLGGYTCSVILILTTIGRNGTFLNFSAASVITEAFGCFVIVTEYEKAVAGSISDKLEDITSQFDLLWQRLAKCVAMLAVIACRVLCSLSTFYLVMALIRKV